MMNSHVNKLLPDMNFIAVRVDANSDVVYYKDVYNLQKK